jgi:hypothetical protein
MPNLLPIKKLAKHQERAKMIITYIFTDTLFILHDAPICFVLMLSWGDYKMNLDAKSSYFLIGIFTEILEGNEVLMN